MEIILDIGDTRKKDINLVGGKGYSLGLMTRAGMPVPPGFIVLTSAFKWFINENGLDLKINSLLQNVKPQDIRATEKVSKSIQKLILHAHIPKEIISSINKEFIKLGEKYVAVRSSATTEDLSSAAWAGQLESYLNTTKDHLLKNIQKCWASLFTPRAIIYRCENGLLNTKISVAVIVQKMVESEISGVAFSANPVTENTDQMLIEAGCGLGEAIVSGKTTPNSYVIEKFPLYISEKKLAEERQQQILTDAQILKLSTMIIEIEKLFGKPQDIEWAYKRGKFYIVQSRPISTLKSSGQKKQTQLELLWEGMQSFYMTYSNITAYKSLKSFCSFGGDSYMIKLTENFAQAYVDRNRIEDAARKGLKDFIRSSWRKSFIEKAESAISQAQIFTKKYCLKNKNLTEKELVYRINLGTRIHQKLYSYFLASGSQYFANVEKYIKSLIPEDIPEKEKDRIIYTLSRSNEQTTMTKNEIEWEELVLDLKKKFKVLPKLQDYSYTKLKRYLEKYSIMSSANGTAPKSLEDLYKTLQSNFSKINSSQKKKDSIKQMKQLKSEQQIMIKKYKLSKKICLLCKEIGRLGIVRLRLRVDGWMPLNFILMKELFPQATKFVPYTVEQIAMCRPHELNQILKSNYLLKQKELDLRVKLTFFGILNNKEVLWTSKKARNMIQKYIPVVDTNIGQIQGQVAMNKGKIIAKCFVLRWNSKHLIDEIESMPSGSVLVAGQIRPQLMSAIKKAVAIVTDEGGILSHSAIVAREFGIPAIIGTKIGTKVLHSGDEVEVDTDNGIVNVLNKVFKNVDSL